MSSDTRSLGERLASFILDTHESQQVFRAVLDAFSRPGVLAQLPSDLVDRVSPALLPVLAVAGHGSAISVVGGDPGDPELVARATNSTVAEPDHSDWVVLSSAGHFRILENCRRGTHVRPDLAAQVVVSVDGGLRVAESTEHGIEISGPGVPSVRHVTVDSPDRHDWSFLDLRVTDFPCGFDILVVDRTGRMVGIPRSSTVTVRSAERGRD